MRTVLAGLALGLTTPAHALELWGTGPLANASVQLTVDSELRYHKTALDDPGRRVSGGPFELIPSMAVHDYFEQVGRFNLLVAKGDLNIGLQFDEVMLFSNRYVLDGELQHSVPLYDDSIQSPLKDGYFLIEKMYLLRLDRVFLGKTSSIRLFLNPFVGFLAVTRYHSVAEVPG